MNIEMKMYDNWRIGRNEGRQEEKREIALKMLKENLPVNLIANVTGLTETEVQELKRGL